MQESDIRVMRGVSIASIVLSVLAILACIACIALFAFGGYVASDSSSFRGYVEYRVGMEIMDEMDAYRGLGPHEASALVSGLFGFFTVLVGIGLLLCVVTLIAGVVGLRACRDQGKAGKVFGWSIAGAICAILMFRVVTAVLLIVNAVYSRRLGKAGETAARPAEGYASPQANFAQQPAPAPQQQWAPYGQPQSAPEPAQPQEPGNTGGSTSA